MNDRTQAEVEEERDTLTAEMKGAIPIEWEPSGNHGYRTCEGTDGTPGLSHSQQTFGPPVEDREASARIAYALIKDKGYPVVLINREAETAWVVESLDGAWFFAVDFLPAQSVITTDTRCFPWDDDVDGPPFEHTTEPTDVVTPSPLPRPSAPSPSPH
jgi:hypothetical protein